MTDIAQLGIEISTDGVSKAAADLDRLVDAGQKAEAGAKSTGSAWSKAATDISRDTQLIVKQLQELNAKQDVTARQMATVGTAVTNAASSFSAAALSITSYQSKSEALNATQQRSADSAQKAGTAARAQADDLAALLGKIDPTVAALGRLDALESKLAQQKKLGNLDTETFNQYQTKIDQTRTSLTRFDDSMTRTGNTAKQTAAALRGVPAQFTDIAVSLQGGQAPLTVFLQQGGQLKDMFGGIGPAARALGGYIVGLVNPFTVAAAAAATLGAVYYDAEKQISGFNKALFSGAANSGETVTGLTAIAKSASDITGNISGARDAVIALAAASGLSRTEFTNLAQAASAIGEFSGKGAGEVAKGFADLGDNATKAAEKISSQYGLITSAQYDVIRLLEEQGKTQEAQDLLSESLNNNAQERLKRYMASLSDVERDWKAIGTAISGAYAQVRGELFPDSGKQIEIIERILKTRADGGLAGAVSTGLSKLNSGLGLGTGDNDDSTAALQQRLTILKTGLAVNQQVAAVAGQEDQKNQTRIEAAKKFNELTVKNLSDEAKLTKDIADTRNLGVAAGKSQAEIEKTIGEIQAKYDDAHKKKKGSSGPVDLSGFNDQKNALAAIVGEYNNAEKELESQRKNGIISQQQYTDQKLVLLKAEADETQGAYDAEINSLQAILDKSSTTAAQRIQVSQKLADVQAQATKAAKDNASQQQIVTNDNIGAMEKEKNSIAAYVEALNERTEALRRSGERAVADVGRGSRQRGLSGELNAEDNNFARDSKTLARDKSKLSDTEFTAKTEALASAHDDATKQILKNYDDITAANENWQNGASAGFADFLEQSQDIAGTTRDLVSGVFTSLTDGISDSIANSIVSGDSLRESLANVAKTIETQLISSLVKLGIQYVVNATLGQSVAAASVGVSAATATATAAVWAPAAALASLASFGANSVPAAAAITSTTLLASTLAAGSALGFEKGGYTGDGGKSEVAGIVHKGEYVIDAATTSRLGRSTLDAMRSGNMQASANASAYSGAASSSGGKGNTYVTFKEDASKAGTASTSQQDGDTYITGWVANIAQQGDAATMLENTYGLKRQGR